MQEFDTPIFKKVYLLYKDFYSIRSSVSKQKRYTIYLRTENTMLELQLKVPQFPSLPDQIKIRFEWMLGRDLGGDRPILHRPEAHVCSLPSVQRLSIKKALELPFRPLPPNIQDGSQQDQRDAPFQSKIMFHFLFTFSRRFGRVSDRSSVSFPAEQPAAESLMSCKRDSVRQPS